MFETLGTLTPNLITRTICLVSNYMASVRYLNVDPLLLCPVPELQQDATARTHTLSTNHLSLLEKRDGVVHAAIPLLELLLQLHGRVGHQRRHGRNQLREGRFRLIGRVGQLLEVHANRREL